MSETRILIRLLRICIFHGTGNSAQLCQTFGISGGLNPPNPLSPRYATESHTPLHFRRTFLPVSWARKVPFCTFKFLCIFETLPDRKILYTYLNSAYKVLLCSRIEVHGTKKKVNFVDQCIWWAEIIMLLVKKICTSSTLICAVFYNYFDGQKAQLPGCAVQIQAPGSPIRNVIIIRYCMGSFVINRLSEELAGYFVLPEDGGRISPRTNR
jgi:hypothetical protein